MTDPVLYAASVILVGLTLAGALVVLAMIPLTPRLPSQVPYEGRHRAR